MSQAESESTTAESFAAFATFATFLGTPLPENPILALRILRKEAAEVSTAAQKCIGGPE
jgi:hypothetical protein